MRAMYNKLFTKILDSSIWLESKPTRIVWVTFIAVMDEHGFAQFATVENVARRANVTVAEARAAIATLEAPDPNSSDPDHDGRRLERVPGGWVVLNAEKYRALVTRAVVQEQTAARVRKHREKQRQALQCNAPVTPSEAVSEARAESETHGEHGAVAPPPAPPADEPLREERSSKANASRSLSDANARRSLTTSGVMAGSLPRDHLRCVQPCGRVCLPENVFVEFAKAKGGPETLACTYVRDWHRRVCDTWDAETGPRGAEPIGDDKYTFWRNRWAEDHGTTKATATDTLAARNARAGAAFLAGDV